MLRGAIDLVHENLIGGWLYSDMGAVRDRIVLAFVDHKCVGSGRIGLMREDLKAAGLGDGRLGFSFEIGLDSPDDLSRVIIKLDGSDAFLLQQTAKIVNSGPFQPICATPDRIDWMRGKGMLAPAEITFLKYVQQLSAFDYSLVQAKTGQNVKAEIATPLTAGQNLFDLLFLRKAVIKKTSLTLADAEEIAPAILAGDGAPLSIVALFSQEPGTLSVVEGSHASGANKGSFDSAIEYQFGPDRLLFLDLNARFKLSTDRQVDLIVLSAC